MNKKLFNGLIQYVLVFVIPGIYFKFFSWLIELMDITGGRYSSLSGFLNWLYSFLLVSIILILPLVLLFIYKGSKGLYLGAGFAFLYSFIDLVFIKRLLPGCTDSCGLENLYTTLFSLIVLIVIFVINSYILKDKDFKVK